jgi:hypothetical protein
MKRFPPFSFVTCTLAALLGLPLLQSVIWCAGCYLNPDLLDQFSVDGTSRDSWEDFRVVLIFGGLFQMFVGLILGGLTALAASLAWPWRRVVLLLLGALGSSFLVLCLWRNWNFERNSGFSRASVIAFDFTMIVPLACPLLWCLGVLLWGATMRKQLEPLPKRNAGDVG